MLFRYLSAAVFCLICRGSADCINGGERYLKFSISNAKNSSGNWVTSGSVELESKREDVEVTFDLIKRVRNCGDGRYLLTFSGHVPGSERTGVETFWKQSLAFHPIHGSNIKLTNDRRTALKIDENKDHGVVYTDRPLRRGEMLTVKLDRINPKQPYNLGIGVTSHTPYDKNIADQYIHTVSNTWLYYHSHIWVNAARILMDYGVPMDDDAHFKVGYTVGVMVTQSGEVHFFINGVDQGPAANNVPNDVYGVVEIRSKTVQVTIVD